MNARVRWFMWSSISLLMIVVLVGCGSSPKDQPVPIPVDAPKVNIDYRLLEECTELPKLKSSRDVDVLEHERQVISEYFKCKASKKALNDEVKKAFNLK